MTDAAQIAVEQTLIVLKPDAVRRGLVGDVVRRFEAKGYQLVALELRYPDRSLLEEHYCDQRDKSFFSSIITYMSSGPVVAAILSGTRVIEGVRNITGATDPAAAAAGTIRGDFGRSWPYGWMENLLHASDSVDSAVREMALWFPDHRTAERPTD